VRPQQELSGFGNQSGVTVAVDGEQQSGQFVGVAVMPGLDGGRGVAELLCGRPDGQAVVAQVRRDAANVGPGAKPQQQFPYKAAGHGVPLPVRRAGRSRCRT
jgi:hypothetical protein